MQPEEQSQSDKQQTETQPANDSINESKSVPTSGKICCPECGGTRVRKRSNLLWFPVAMAAMLIILSGQYVMVLLPYGRYLLFISYLLMFALYAACIFVWMQLFRYSRCKNCGHKFPTILGSRQEQNPIDFPIARHSLNWLR